MRGLKDIRLNGYDYKENGYYFVTIIADQRRSFLASREKIIESELFDLVAKTVGLSIDCHVIMPNHVHIIFVLENSNLTLGEIVRRFKAKTSHRIGFKLWQPNYYEHVIRNEPALQAIREYILANPLVEKPNFKKLYADAN